MAIGSRECSICGVVKSNDFFSKGRSQCTPCRGQRNVAHHFNDLPSFLKSKLVRGKHIHKDKASDIDLDYLMELHEKQKGCCAISGIPMMYSPTFIDLSVSIDRIQSSQGYVKGNVQLVCSRINMMKSVLEQEKFIWWCRAVANKYGN